MMVLISIYHIHYVAFSSCCVENLFILFLYNIFAFVGKSATLLPVVCPGFWLVHVLSWWPPSSNLLAWMKLKLKQRRWGKEISGMLTRAAGPGSVWQCDTSLVFKWATSWKLKHMINKHGDDGEAPKTRFKVYSQIYSQLLTLFFLYLFIKYWLTNDMESLPRSWPIRVITSSVIMSLSRPTKRVSRQSWPGCGGAGGGAGGGAKVVCLSLVSDEERTSSWPVSCYRMYHQPWRNSNAAY